MGWFGCFPGREIEVIYEYEKENLDWRWNPSHPINWTVGFLPYVFIMERSANRSIVGG